MKALKENSIIKIDNIDVAFPDESDSGTSDVQITTEASENTLLPLGASDVIEMFKEMYDSALPDEKSSDVCVSCLNGFKVFFEINRRSFPNNEKTQYLS